MSDANSSTFTFVRGSRPGLASSFFISFIVLGVIGWFISILICHPIDELVAFAGKYTDEEKSSDEGGFTFNH